MAKAVKTQGTKLYYSSGSPTEWVAIGNVTGFDGPGGSSAEIDQTNLDDTQYKSKITSLIDAGDVSFDINLDPSLVSHAALKAAQEAGTLLEIKITPATGSLSLYFNAYVKQMRVSGPADGKYKAAVAFMLDGGYNWTA